MKYKEFWNKHRILLSIISTAVIAIPIVYSVLYSFFQIQEIDIIGNGILATLDESQFDRSLLFLSESRIESMVMQGSHYITDVKVTKKYPHTLIINIKGRLPRAIVRDRGNSFLVDDTGFILGIPNEHELFPIIDISTNFIDVDSYENSQEIQQALHFLIGVHSTMDVLTIEKYDTISLKVLTEDGIILIPIEKEISEVLTSLQTIKEGFRMKGVLPKTIDLRFNKPIIIE
jgi:hypothetical protein